MGRLSGKVALVTGAGRPGNIGLAVCHAFLREGCAAVVATDIHRDDVDRLTAEVGDAFGPDRFRYLDHDVTDADSWDTVVDRTVGEFGGLDVLVNNAGISRHGGVESTTLESLRSVMAVNHDALFLGMKHCLSALSDSVTRFDDGGAIINNLSMATYMPNPRNLGYAVSKAAGRMLTLCAAEEFGPRRIRVNSVHPGVTMTPLMEEGFQSYVRSGRWADRASGEAELIERTPLRMTSRPEDTAHAFVYLASAESRFVTGATIQHDGGLGRRF